MSINATTYLRFKGVIAPGATDLIITQDNGKEFKLSDLLDEFHKIQSEGTELKAPEQRVDTITTGERFPEDRKRSRRY